MVNFLYISFLLLLFCHVSLVRSYSAMYGIEYGLLEGNNSSPNFTITFENKTAVTFKIWKDSYTMVYLFARVVIVINNSTKFLWNPFLIGRVEGLTREMYTSGGFISVTGTYFDNTNFTVSIGHATLPLASKNGSLYIFSVQDSIIPYLTSVTGGNDLIVFNDPDPYTFTFQFKPPVINTLSMNSQYLFIYGDSFGIESWKVQCFIDGSPLNIVNFTRSTNIVTDLASPNFRTLGTRSITLTLEDKIASKTIDIYPLINSVSSVSSSTGGPITIFGIGLNLTRIDNSVIQSKSIIIGGVNCTNITQVNSYDLECQYPSFNKSSNSTTKDLNIKLVLDGFEANPFNFNYDQITINSMYKQKGMIIRVVSSVYRAANLELSLFKYDDKTLILSGLAVVNSSVKGENMFLDFQIPRNIYGTFLAQISNLSNLYSFDWYPKVTFVVSPRTSGDILFINGEIFSDPVVISISDSAIKCKNAKVITTTLIACNLTKGSGKDIRITLGMNGTILESKFSYLPPTLSKALISDSPDSDGNRNITVIGHNFDDKNLFIKINNTIDCGTLHFMNDTTLICTISEIVYNDLKSIVNIDDSSSSSSFIKLYVSVNGQSVTAPRLLSIEKDEPTEPVDKTFIILSVMTLVIAAIGLILLITIILYIRHQQNMKQQQHKKRRRFGSPTRNQ
ncbi:immunoglobulin E-set domain-containing protein [Heterostelium album PN500]|uniref:Immunoglobulin E-set domain-containing protein n=1 Tax=Heterostelium pallidum (strain ATCC 26659 / Pp 5 / PN500) TaxID=670386 RepID=D3B6E2_HETP5|nr:immunoglobulin E-set domain-containing protein [Heterostelium album PN500]EFA82912.1 immunoglobulin E-set domain-containing protein [Heterostelium album PN500]|eukprot:XP_020435029.1 immunoglobulin E-set domain-containing protein [Heterostelium album PN500]